MADNNCEDCVVRELRRINQLVEKRMAGKLPEEVSKPLFEAKKQMRLALRGFITHLLEEKPAGNEKQPDMSRPIKLE